MSLDPDFLAEFKQQSYASAPNWYAQLTGDEAIIAVALLFDECSDDDGQWDGAGICEAVWRLIDARGLSATCDECGMVYAAIRGECPFHTSDEGVGNGGMSAVALMRHHLQHNLFPPLDDEWLPVAQAAIDAAERGELNATLLVPNSTLRVAVRKILDGLNLWDFVRDVDDVEPEPSQVDRSNYTEAELEHMRKVIRNAGGGDDVIERFGLEDES